MTHARRVSRLCRVALPHNETKISDDPAHHDEEDLDQPIFSLVTGKYRHTKRYGGVYLLLQRIAYYLTQALPCRSYLTHSSL